MNVSLTGLANPSEEEWARVGLRFGFGGGGSADDDESRLWVTRLGGGISVLK